MPVLILGSSRRQYTGPPPISGIRFQAAGGFPDRSWSSFYMQLSRYALCGLLDPAARGPVPGL